jgi:hypothetical protein
MFTGFTGIPRGRLKGRCEGNIKRWLGLNLSGSG